MSTRLKDSERTKLIAEFIRTGKSPAGYEITVNESSKYKVRRIKPKNELLKSKRDRLLKQLELVEAELKAIQESEQYDTKDDNLEDNKCEAQAKGEQDETFDDSSSEQ